MNMGKLLRTELSRAFLNKRSGLIFLLAALSFTYGYSQVGPSLADAPLGALTIWQLILQRGYYGFFAALMAALPFSDSLSAEKKEGFLSQLLLRADYRQYLAAKFLAVAASGFAAVLIPAGLLLAVCGFSFSAGLVQVPDVCFYLPLNRNLIPPDACRSLLPNSYMLLCLLFLGLFGYAYASLAMAASFHSKNAIVAFGAAMLVYSFGFYIIPTSIRLNWLVSTEAALIPTGNLLSPIVQYLTAGLLMGFNWLVFGKKERQVLS
jgi:hypothetical protein